MTTSDWPQSISALWQPKTQTSCTTPNSPTNGTKEQSWRPLPSRLSPSSAQVRKLRVLWNPYINKYLRSELDTIQDSDADIWTANISKAQTFLTEEKAINVAEHLDTHYHWATLIRTIET